MSGSAPAAFSRAGVFALVVGGFALLVGLLYLIGAGADFGGERGRGQAHAAANGLNGYAGLVRLIEAGDYDVERSRSPQALQADGLLILAPTAYADADDITKILQDRAFIGPTLVIMPKWRAAPPPEQIAPEAKDKFKRGWVILIGAAPAADWPEDLPKAYRFKHELVRRDPVTPADLGKPDKTALTSLWSGMGYAGRLPTATTLHAVPAAMHDTLITDGAGRVLAFSVNPGEGIAPGRPAYPVVFLAEPDLANNFGLADAKRAAATMTLVGELSDEASTGKITFDMTLNGFGASENLLTLAFRPPFLAATLSLLVALLIVGWRAFQRFGPPAAPAGPDIAFGKRQLIANGAGLIVRARRFALLGAPYAALSARRLADRLGLARAEPQAIDAALARRLPEEEPFTRRAARLEAADKPADILAAAQSLDALTTKLSQGQ